MSPSALVLANLPEAAAHTMRYAAALGQQQAREHGDLTRPRWALIQALQ
jgi:hypothetical protein